MLPIIVSFFVFCIVPLEVTSVDITTDNVTIFLFTRENRNIPQEVQVTNLSDLSNSNYNSSRINYFLVHGLYSDWRRVEVLKDPILDGMDANVLLLDYSGPSMIFEIHDETIVAVGKIFADFIDLMKSAYGLVAENFIILGYSMGAHVAGEAGRHLNGEVGIMVALDAANMTPPIMYIDTDKAHFLQSVHTSTVGVLTPLGHASYFPNTPEQPGCNGTPNCDHRRAVDYFAESLATGGFSAVRCDSYSSFEQGLCSSNERSHLGGIELDTSARGSYYLRTNSAPPYSIAEPEPTPEPTSTPGPTQGPTPAPAGVGSLRAAISLLPVMVHITLKVMGQT